MRWQERPPLRDANCVVQGYAAQAARLRNAAGTTTAESACASVPTPARTPPRCRPAAPAHGAPRPAALCPLKKNPPTPPPSTTATNTPPPQRHGMGQRQPTGARLHHPGQLLQREKHAAQEHHRSEKQREVVGEKIVALG